MVDKTLARTGAVVVEAFWHVPGEGAAAVEQWPATSVAFTATGAWWVRGPGGGGLVDAGWLLAGRTGEEFECRHPHGVTDRALSVCFLGDVEPASAPLVRVDARGRRLRRRLYRAVTARRPDTDEIDAAAAAVLGWAREPADAAPAVGARTREQVARVRREADRGFADAELDLVAIGGAAGLSRTRLVHAFGELVGVTPHRYLRERRLTHAARLLADSDMPVADVCFGCGFGSLARFNAAFRAAHGLTPTGFRAVCRQRTMAARGS
ncbi:MAG TPA: AraC family transcriptional regulator [Streptosporangiaceae bacterium]|jgi:AraC-like DNA-binding protein